MQAPAKNPPFTILVVDDNEFVLRPVSRFLEEAGYAVQQARNGQEALEKARRGVDLVLLDIMMPGLTGTDVLATLRKDYSDEELPVIMITASGGSEQIVKSFELGANDYVTKPLDFPVLMARLKSRLRSRAPRAAAPAGEPKPARGIDVGSVLDGKYRLESRIGKGNFAEVFKARHLKLDHEVAVKLLRVGAGDEAELRQRFQREGRSACRIDHINAVSVFDSSVTSCGVPYLVTELLRGHTLEQEILQHGPLSPERCLAIVRPICDVLAETHDLGIVHRDIKPQNIFLHSATSGEIVKVLDFGIAKLIDDVAPLRVASGAGPGTPTYMAPERFAKRHECDGKADVYSLGVVLYKMLIGRVPFAVTDGNLMQLALLHQFESPRRLRELRPSLPLAVEAIVLRALEKAPEARPSARQLAVELDAAFEVEALGVPPRGVPTTAISTDQPQG